MGGLVMVGIISKAYSMEGSPTGDDEGKRRHFTHTLSMFRHPINSLREGLSHLPETSLVKKGFSLTSETLSKADQVSERISKCIGGDHSDSSLAHRLLTSGADYFRNLSTAETKAPAQLLEAPDVGVSNELLSMITSEDKPTGKHSARRVNCVGQAMKDVENSNRLTRTQKKDEMVARMRCYPNLSNYGRPYDPKEILNYLPRRM